MKNLLLFGLFVAAAYGYKTYEGYRVIEATPTKEIHHETIQALRKDFQLDFWDDIRLLGVPTKIMVPPHRFNRVTTFLKNAGISYTTTVENVAVNVKAERERLAARKASGKVFDLNEFNTYDDIMAELPLMAGRCPPSISCTVDTLGLSVEGRPINTLRITGGSGRRGYWIDSAIHAREWLSPATHLNIMDSFTRNYGIDPDITNLIDTYDWHFTPIMNPDGYVFSHTDDRYWRKSRNDNAGSLCIGTDLNRNYDVNWMHDGTDSSPCSDVYGGTAPESAQETAIVAAEIRRIGSSLDGFITIHTAAEMWLHPWGHTDDNGDCVLAVDHDDQTRVIQAAIQAVRDTHNDGVLWTAGNTCLTIYPASGTTGDYARSVGGGGVQFSITPELRGPDFVVPASDIAISFAETWNGIKAFVAEIEATP